MVSMAYPYCATGDAASGSRNQLTRSTQARKCLEREPQVLTAVGGGQHDAQARRITGHGRKGHGLHKDSGAEQLGTQELGTLGIADHDGCDGCLCTSHVEAKRPHAFLKDMGVLSQLGHRVLRLLEELDRRKTGGHISGRGRA